MTHQPDESIFGTITQVLDDHNQALKLLSAAVELKCKSVKFYSIAVICLAVAVAALIVLNTALVIRLTNAGIL